MLNQVQHDGRRLLQPQHMLPERPRVVEGIVRHYTVRRRAESAERQEPECERRDRHHLAGAGHQQIAELRDVLGPVGNNQRLRVHGEIMRQADRRVATAEAGGHQSDGNMVEEGSSPPKPLNSVSRK